MCDLCCVGSHPVTGLSEELDVAQREGAAKHCHDIVARLDGSLSLCYICAGHDNMLCVLVDGIGTAKGELQQKREGLVRHRTIHTCA